MFNIIVYSACGAYNVYSLQLCPLFISHHKMDINIFTTNSRIQLSIVHFITHSSLFEFPKRLVVYFSTIPVLKIYALYLLLNLSAVYLLVCTSFICCQSVYILSFHLLHIILSVVAEIYIITYFHNSNFVLFRFLYTISMLSFYFIEQFF